MIRRILFGPVLGFTLGLGLASLATIQQWPVFREGLAGLLIQLAVSGVVGAIVAASAVALVQPAEPRTGRSPSGRQLRIALSGALVAVLGAFLLRHDVTLWLILEPVCSGFAPMGRMIVATLPVTSLAAGALAVSCSDPAL